MSASAIALRGAGPREAARDHSDGIAAILLLGGGQPVPRGGIARGPAPALQARAERRGHVRLFRAHGPRERGEPRGLGRRARRASRPRGRVRATETYEAYPPDLVPLLLSLATQAAVCLKANHLTASIRKLFENFAQAAIVAAAQRDPTTAGHSNRVAMLTVEMAGLVDRAAEGPYASVSFSREEMREIFTAALLHDFGKISIPERVLVKAKKIEADGLHRIRDRFDYALAAAESEDARLLLERLAREGRPVTEADLRALEDAAGARSRELEEAFEEVAAANEPTVLPRDARGALERLVTRTYRDRRGRTETLLL